MTTTANQRNGVLTAAEHQAAKDFSAFWTEGRRHNSAKALAGGLARAGWAANRITSFVEEVASAASDDDTDNRLEAVSDTIDALRDGLPVTGWPTLARLIGPNGDRAVRDLLDGLNIGHKITLAELAEHKRLPIEFLEGLGLHDLSGGGVGIPYHDAGGKVVATKNRFGLKADSYRWPKGRPTMVYGEDHLDAATTAGFQIVVEGETDVLTLRLHGFPGLGVPGSDNAAKTLQQGHVARVPVIFVLLEPDPAGKDFVDNVRKRLADLRFKGQLRIIRLDGIKDPSALHIDDPERFKARFQAAIDRAEVASLTTVTAPKKRVRTLAPYQPFPVHALPEPIRSFVIESASALGCDEAYLALPVLAVVASGIGNTRVILLKNGWYEPSVAWSVIIGESGTLKSPAYHQAVNHLFHQQHLLLKEYKVARDRYEVELAEWEAAKRKKDDGAGERPTPPILPRIICSDTTIEKLAAILGDNPRGTLVACDELAGWLGSFQRYKGKSGGTDLPHWLSMFRAGPVVIDRKTGDRPTIFVERAAVSICGGIQPGVLARYMTPEFLSAGGAARLLMAMPPTKPKRWTDIEVDPATEAAYHRLLDTLLRLDFDSDENKAPVVLRLTADAKAVWTAFYDRWAHEQAGSEGDLAAAFSKLEGYAARLSLLHHVVSHIHAGADDCCPIGSESVLAGITLMRWFADEARRIYTTFTETAEERDTRRLLDFIRANDGRMTARRLQRSNPRKYPTADDAEGTLQGMVDAGLGVWDEQPAGPKGGHPTRTFILYPTPDTTDTTSPDRDGDDPVEPADLHDGPTGPVPPTGGIPPENEGCVSSVRRSPQRHNAPNGGESPEPSSEGCVRREEVVSGSSVRREEVVSGSSVRREDDAAEPNYQLVRDAAGLQLVTQALDESTTVALDTETTGLDPRQDRVRLLSLGTDRGTFLVDCFAVNPRPLWEFLSDKTIIGHNLLFDLSFLAALGFQPGTVRDTMLLSRILTAGKLTPKGYHGLDACLQRSLGIIIDKSEQRSDWSRQELSYQQLHYAARDVAHLLTLHDHLKAKVKVAALERVAALEMGCLLGIVWLSLSGVPFDQPAWQALAQIAGAEADALEQQLDAAAPSPPQRRLDDGGGWTWDSPADVKAMFAGLGVTLEKADDDALAGVEHPLADLLRRYRGARKRASTYGLDWLTYIGADGRVHCDWQQMGARTGRMSAAKPNLQNIPGDASYRRCFWAPQGRVLVKADYSQIELRIAAKVANEERMIDAYRRGDDLHRLTAQQITGRQEITKHERQLAKPVNFGLIYGMGTATLLRKARVEYGVSMTAKEADSYRQAFFDAWPGIRQWHNELKRQSSRKVTETRTLTGRRVIVEADFWYGGRANYIVQGTGGDGLKLALGLLWARRNQVPGAFPVLTVHDEIVVETDADQADAAKTWLKAAMIDAMTPLIEPVPVEVEVSVGQTWGGEP